MSPIRAAVPSEAAYAASQQAEQTIFAHGDAASHEQQVDCMATVITGSTRDSYYTRSCAGARAKNAQAMWATWGGIHQDPQRAWTTGGAPDRPRGLAR